MKEVEPGQFWTVDFKPLYRYVVTIQPFDGGWLCCPLAYGYAFLSERDVYLSYGCTPDLERSMVLTWLNVSVLEEDLVRCFGHLDQEMFDLVLRLRHGDPIPEDRRWRIGWPIADKWLPEFGERYPWQQNQMEIWQPVTARTLSRIFASEVDPEPGPDTRPQ